MQHVWSEVEAVELLQSLGIDPGERELTLRAILVELLLDAFQRSPAPTTIGELRLALERSHDADGDAVRLLLETVRRSAAERPDQPLGSLRWTG